MSTITVESLTTYADELATTAAAALADTVGGEIERAGLTAGLPAFDCEQVTVAVISLGDAQQSTLSTLGAGRRHMSGAVNLIGFRITVLRDCIATIEEDGDLPTVAEMRNDAIKVHQDVWAIWTRIRRQMMAGELFGGRCSKLFFDGARATATEGGMAGWEIDFRANIPGFANDAP
jgi:hypothetical protein